MRQQSEKILVTGLGLVTPLGIGVDTNWRALIEGKSGVGPISKFDASPLPTQIAAEVKNFNPEDFIDKKSIKQMDAFIQYAMAAAKIAVEHAGLDTSKPLGER